MKKSNISKLHKLIGKKGFFITAIAIMITIGGAGVAAYNKTVKKLNDNLLYSASDSSKSIPENILADKKQNDVSFEDNKESLITQPNIMPLNGDIINPFSNGELVKSKTLNVWKTHDGVDIKAEKGSQVKAMNHGEITKIWNDPLWGNCLTIDHGNGIVSYYYNLSPSTSVEEGDIVDAGDVIGSVGDSAQIEVIEESHLHFAIKRNGEWIDPIEYIDPNFTK